MDSGDTLILLIVVIVMIQSLNFNLKDNSTMNETEAQLVSYGILYLKPSSYHCQPSHKKYIAALKPP